MYYIYCNFSLAFIVMLGYLIKGLDYLLIPIFVFELCKFIYTSLEKKRVSKEFLYILSITIFIILSSVFNGNYQQSIKISIYMFSSYFIMRSDVFSPKVFIIGVILSFVYYTLFIQGLIGMFGGLSFYVYARNYTVFIVVFLLFLFIKSPHVINALTFVSLSRWNFMSLLGSKSILLVLALPIAAYVKIFYFDFDTGAGLKTSSDDIRALLTKDVTNNLGYFILGVPASVIEYRLSLIFTADTYESIFLERYALFGLFSIPLLIHHIRLMFLGLSCDDKKSKYALYYLFLFPIFNPLTFSLMYYIFYYYYYGAYRNESEK